MSTNQDSLDNDLQSDYLKAVDIEDVQPVVFTIVHLDKRPVGRDLEMKRLAVFAEHEKPMILNVTAIKALRDLYGSDPEKLKGKQVTLINTYTDYNGKSHRVIRIAPEVPKKPVRPLAEELGDDDIPMN